MPNDKNAMDRPADFFRLTTDEFAERYLVKPQSVRKQYSTKGSYFGIKPRKLPNGKLAWPDNTLGGDASSV